MDNQLKGGDCRGCVIRESESDPDSFSWWDVLARQDGDAVVPNGDVRETFAPWNLHGASQEWRVEQEGGGTRWSNTHPGDFTVRGRGKFEVWSHALAFGTGW